MNVTSEFKWNRVDNEQNAPHLTTRKTQAAEMSHSETISVNGSFLHTAKRQHAYFFRDTLSHQHTKPIQL